MIKIQQTIGQEKLIGNLFFFIYNDFNVSIDLKIILYYYYIND